MVAKVLQNPHYKSLASAGNLLEAMQKACKDVNNDGAGFIIPPEHLKKAWDPI